MATPVNDGLDERRHVDLEPRYHPGRSHRDLLQQCEMGIEVGRSRRGAPSKPVREHEAVDRGWQPRPACRHQGAQPRKTELVDSVARAHVVSRADPQTLCDVVFRIEVDEARLPALMAVDAGEVHAARIDHCPIDETASGGTRVTVDTDLSVLGKLATLGFGIMQRKAQENMNQFAANMKRRMEEGTA